MCVLSRQPQNILLTSSSPLLGDIKIVDFGLSRIISNHQELREIMGTPEYVGEMLLILASMASQELLHCFDSKQKLSVHLRSS